MGKTTELKRLNTLLENEKEFLPIFSQFGSQENISESALIAHMAQALYSHP